LYKVKLIRYALATFCFAASVGCLALWWRSMTTWDLLNVPSYAAPGRALNLQAFSGTATVFLVSEGVSSRLGFGVSSSQKWRHTAMAIQLRDEYPQSGVSIDDAFQRMPRGVYFPLWYPALVFAIATLRFRRQFSIRSALVGLTVVAALLGTVVTL
jgi:hypothetical protein